MTRYGCRRTFADAPSPGAWSMLLVARKDKRWFPKDVLPKLRRKREDKEEKSSRRAEKKWIGNSRQVAAKHYLQTTPEHVAEAVSGARTIFVASRAPQGVANEKSDARQTAKTSSPAQCVALAMGVTGLEPVTSTV